MKKTTVQILISTFNLRNICGKFLDLDVEEVMSSDKKRPYFLQFEETPVSGEKFKATLIQPMHGKPRDLGKVFCEFTKGKYWVFTKTDKKEKNKIYISAPIAEQFKKVDLPVPKVVLERKKLLKNKKPVKK